MLPVLVIFGVFTAVTLIIVAFSTNSISKDGVSNGKNNGTSGSNGAKHFIVNLTDAVPITENRK